MSALEELVNVADSIYWTPEQLWLRKYKPGEWYNSLPEETKEKLKQLKSDDLKNLRLDEVFKLQIQHTQYLGQWARDRRK